MVLTSRGADRVPQTSPCLAAGRRRRCRRRAGAGHCAGGGAEARAGVAGRGARRGGAHQMRSHVQRHQPSHAARADQARHAAGALGAFCTASPAVLLLRAEFPHHTVCLLPVRLTPPCAPRPLPQQQELETKWRVVCVVRGRYYAPGELPAGDTDELRPLFMRITPGRTLPAVSGVCMAGWPVGPACRAPRPQPGGAWRQLVCVPRTTPTCACPWPHRTHSGASMRATWRRRM